MDYLSGKVFAHTVPRYRHQEWLVFLRKIDQQVAPEFELHIICDNYSTHKHAKVTAWLKRHLRFHIHFIPTSSSWLNLVERFFGEITGKVIRPGSFRSVAAMVTDIFRFLDHHNLNPKAYRWTADPKRIPEKLDRAWEALLEEIYNPVYGTSHYTASRIDADFLNAHPALNFITTRSAGHDHIDVGECSRRGVVVCEVLDVDCYHIAESGKELWQKLDIERPRLRTVDKKAFSHSEHSVSLLERSTTFAKQRLGKGQKARSFLDIQFITVLKGICASRNCTILAST